MSASSLVFWALLAILGAAFLRLLIWVTEPKRQTLLDEHYSDIERLK